MPWLTIQALTLFAAAALGIWGAIHVFGRPDAPGRLEFGWLQLAIALWCLTSGLHALVVSLPEKIAVAQVQYIGIATTPVLWLLFAGRYTRRLDLRGARSLVLWIVPALTIASAATNASHHLLWRDVVAVGAPPTLRAVYIHGPWFWIFVSFNYAALATGSIWLLRSFRSVPRQLRAQMGLLLVAVAAPWLGNLIYLARLLPAAWLDPTPLAFAVSGVCFVVGLFRFQLFDVVPIARTILFDRLADAVFVLDAGERIIDMNGAGRTLAGERAVIGGRVRDALPWLPPLAALPRDSHPASVIEAEGRSLDVAVTPIAEQGRRPAWLIVVRDITERLRAAAEQRALDRRLQDEQRVASLEVLARGLAHDFSSLLQSILGNAEVTLMQLPAESPVRDSAGAIIVGAESAIELVGRMRLYAGGSGLAFAPVTLGPLVEDMVDLLRRTAGKHCEITIAAREPVTVMADATQIRQILLNLIVNAAEAAGARGCTICLRIDRTGSAPANEPDLVIAPPNETGPFALIEVRDTGPGIAPAILPRVFDPFFTTKTAGRGLGLAAVLGIVRGHHGALAVTSAPAQGTTIRVWLPRGDTPHEDA